MTRTLSLLSFAALTACAVSSASLLAQPYPYKPIRIVVGFQPGGGVDMSARTVGQPLGATLGQTVVVDNRPGAAGNIAAGYVAKATPDGYTLLMANSTISSPTLFKSLPFDVRKDLDPVGLIAIGPSVLIVHPSVPARNVGELIALAKAKPGTLGYASGGVGNFSHLAGELFSLATGVKLVHVPYKGVGPGMMALLAGDVQLMFNNIQTALEHVRAGKVAALGVSEPQRVALLPGVPTVAETVPGFEMAPWVGIIAPANTPKDVVARLSQEVLAVMRDPETINLLTSQQVTAMPLAPDEFGHLIRKDLDKWATVIKSAGIKGE